MSKSSHGRYSGKVRYGSVSDARVSVYERVAERVSELLQKGVVPWQKPWSVKVGRPRNGKTGRYYRGLNVFMLSACGYDSPWWFTPKQVNELGGYITKGEKVSWVQFWKPWLPKGSEVDPSVIEDEAENGGAGGRRRKAYLIVRSYRVVNLLQCEGPGVDKFKENHPEPKVDERSNDPIAWCEEIVAGMPDAPSIVHGGNKACYWPAMDAVNVPMMKRFKSSEQYYGVVFHELTHSTGHEKRLNRKTLVAGAPFGSPTYSREELVAEMGAAFLCAMAGIIDPTIDNSAAYISGWLSFIKSDPKALLVAGAQAQKAADYILGDAGVEEVEAEAELAEVEAVA